MIQPSSGKEKETVWQVSVLGPEKTVKACQECGSVSNGRRTLLLGQLGRMGGKLDIEVVAAAAPLRLSSLLPSAQSPLATATLRRRRLVQ